MGMENGLGRWRVRFSVLGWGQRPGFRPSAEMVLGIGSLRGLMGRPRRGFLDRFGLCSIC